MTRQERAKQFMPFDAMKGLQEALREQEDKHLREERRELSEEQIERLDYKLKHISKGMKIEVMCYTAFRYVKLCGTVQEIDSIMQRIVLEDKTIDFQDLFAIKIVDIKK